MKQLVFFSSLILTLFFTGCKANDLQTTPPLHPQNFDMEMELKAEENDYIVEAKVTLLMETSQYISINFNLEELSSSNQATAANQASNRRFYEEELYHGTWLVGEEKYFKVPLHKLPEGEFDIRIQALTEEDETGERWGGLATLNFMTNRNGEVFEKAIHIVTDQ